ncbi:peptidylprolyl isomerase [Flagellimonas sp. DF-77]|uniref:peptidylprolyl isomerase n=1 Tax=Flagellimonas algarum TaxID=3230298 RepID=UPI003394086D
MFRKPYLLIVIICVAFSSCSDRKTAKTADQVAETEAKDTIEKRTDTAVTQEPIEEAFQLTEANAIDFFFDYAKNTKENRVKLTTSMGSFTIELYQNVPYHKANFIYLAKAGYFDNTMFHRVVKDFIIQGGNADNTETASKRRKIGRYLLPPDTRKGHKHHRGTISMPSSERDNPHKLASPYEFFIVVTQPGSYHLDGDYTPFGRVIDGMDVVDRINQVPVDQGEWPMQNVYILKAEVL